MKNILFVLLLSLCSFVHAENKYAVCYTNEPFKPGKAFLIPSITTMEFGKNICNYGSYETLYGKVIHLNNQQFKIFNTREEALLFIDPDYNNKLNQNNFIKKSDPTKWGHNILFFFRIAFF